MKTYEHTPAVFGRGTVSGTRVHAPGVSGSGAESLLLRHPRITSRFVRVTLLLHPLFLILRRRGRGELGFWPLGSRWRSQALLPGCLRLIARVATRHPQ